MRIKKISSDEVTVYLSRQDLEYFDFHVDGGVPREGELNNFLFELMEVVHNETGFDPYTGGQVMVEAVHSQSGMKLNISRVSVGKRQKLTRAQFGRVKSISVKSEEAKIRDNLAKLAHDLMLNSQNSAKRQASETFVFGSFDDMELALCSAELEDIIKCVLYRSGDRYAIVARTRSGSRLYNTLSEFADIFCGGDVLAADINEGWIEVAGGEKLKAMAEAVRSMR